MCVAPPFATQTHTTTPSASPEKYKNNGRKFSAVIQKDLKGKLILQGHFIFQFAFIFIFYYTPKHIIILYTYYNIIILLVK